MMRWWVRVCRIDGTDDRAAGIHMAGHVEVMARGRLVLVRVGRYGSSRARVFVSNGPWFGWGRWRND